MTRIYSPEKTPIILAHRGGGAEGNENTYATFDAVYGDGFRYIETDVRTTRDGIPVFFHDATLLRTLGVQGEVADYDWDDFQSVCSDNGYEVMRVDECLDRFDTAVFNIDIKEQHAIEPLAQAIMRTGAHDRVCVASFSDSRLRTFRRIVPDVATSLGIMSTTLLSIAAYLPHPLVERIVRTYGDSVQAIQIPTSFKGIPVFTDRLVHIAHKHNLAVHVWTVNDDVEAAHLLQRGADGIVTDRPRAMRDYFIRQGIEIASA